MQKSAGLCRRAVPRAEGGNEVSIRRIFGALVSAAFVLATASPRRSNDRVWNTNKMNRRSIFRLTDSIFTTLSRPIRYTSPFYSWNGAPLIRNNGSPFEYPGTCIECPVPSTMEKGLRGIRWQKARTRRTNVQLCDLITILIKTNSVLVSFELVIVLLKMFSLLI